jgi:nucleotide-binding universal stress UspA family protein
MDPNIYQTARGGENRMPNTSLLVVIDESTASERAVSYVAQIIGGRKGFRVCLAHPLPELPASLIEHGGAENPTEEKVLDSELRAEQKDWVAEAKKKAEPALNGARAVLRNAGLTAGSIEERFSFPAQGRARSEDILELAKESKCDTVVVGSESPSWPEQLVGKNPVEELIRRGKGFTIWVVE